MPNVFARNDQVPCRSCGAIEGRPGEKKRHGLCDHCCQNFLRWTRQVDGTADQTGLNEWLGRQLFLSARRLQIYGVTGRCEAITRGNGALYSGHGFYRAGYQCGRVASVRRDGRNVCASHIRARNIDFVESHTLGIYEEFSRLIAELCAVDPKFFEAAKAAVESVSASCPPSSALSDQIPR